jgi:hypothetical protein
MTLLTVIEIRKYIYIYIYIYNNDRFILNYIFTNYYVDDEYVDPRVAHSRRLWWHQFEHHIQIE